MDDQEDFLQQLVDAHYLNGAALSITKQVLDRGYSSLSPAQQSVYDNQVTAVFVTPACDRCSNEIPWSEMYEAYENGGYCGYCQHMQDKLERE